MCSSPKPKKQSVKRPSRSSSEISVDMMSRFAARANAADERRQARIESQKTHLDSHLNTDEGDSHELERNKTVKLKRCKKAENPTHATHKNSWIYWLLGIAH
ncbi:MAG: hypothetical protein ACI93R_001249 [Flavobacteriales bacterium]|jgi:hypothetical protein